MSGGHSDRRPARSCPRWAVLDSRVMHRLKQDGEPESSPEEYIKNGLLQRSLQRWLPLRQPMIFQHEASPSQHAG